MVCRSFSSIAGLSAGLDIDLNVRSMKALKGAGHLAGAEFGQAEESKSERCVTYDVRSFLVRVV